LWRKFGDRRGGGVDADHGAPDRATSCETFRQPPHRRVCGTDQPVAGRPVGFGGRVENPSSQKIKVRAPAHQALEPFNFGL
ncbi:MAG: hypothetical protein OWT27_08580, partial [Firmicutes bacterium]|nr:hypothetical protein [Bacillota bacterium]